MSKRRAWAKKRRRRLFNEQKGLCIWCGCKMILVGMKNGGRVPPNAATIDHLRDRFHPGRVEPARGEKRWVAACWTCNNERGKQNQSVQSREELWRRAGHLERMLATDGNEHGGASA